MQGRPNDKYISYTPGPLALRVISKVHTAIYKFSRGTVGQRLDGLDMLLLTTQGRKSGKFHQTPMPYFDHPEGYLLIASNAGRKSNPAWYYNLLHEPRVMIQVKSDIHRMIASPLDPAVREQWWHKLVALQPRFAEYQVSTQRTIPIVFLYRQDTDHSIDKAD